MPQLLQTETKKIISNLRSLPKAELHIHLEGAARWSTLRKALHHHKGLTLPEQPKFHRSGFRFANFMEFQECFLTYIHPWLQTPSGYAELIQDVVNSLIEQHIRYVELNCCLPMVERHGASLEFVLELLEEAVQAAQERGTVIRIIAGVCRHHGVEAASSWVRRLLKYPIVSGFDLHGDELEWSADLFRAAIAPAHEAGKKIKVHAGEMSGAESIRAAVEELGATQIGHGTSAIQDPTVVDLLSDRNILLEMCPTSNDLMGCIPSYQAHPILELDAAGVAVTVNSDDPTFFGVNLTDELARLIVERDIGAEVIARWTRNAFQRAILDDQIRSQFEAELDAWLQEQLS